MGVPIVIVGAGGFGREVLGLIKAINSVALRGAEEYDFLGYIDDGVPDYRHLSRLSVKHLGGAAVLHSMPSGTQYCIGIGNGQIRRGIDALASKLGLMAATLVHPDATMGPDVALGPGSIVCAGARLTDNIVTGRHVDIHVNSTVGHDAVLGDYSTVLPLASVSGNVSLGAGATVGTNSCINQDLNIGNGAFVASGASVINDVDSNTLVAGVPALVKKSLVDLTGGAQ